MELKPEESSVMICWVMTVDPIAASAVRHTFYHVLFLSLLGDRFLLGCQHPTLLQHGRVGARQHPRCEEWMLGDERRSNQTEPASVRSTGGVFHVHRRIRRGHQINSVLLQVVLTGHIKQSSPDSNTPSD